MTDDNENNRIIFRPTEQQYKRINNLFMASGRYKTMSEMLRHMTEISLEVLEKEVK